MFCSLARTFRDQRGIPRVSYFGCAELSFALGYGDVFCNSHDPLQMTAFFIDVGTKLTPRVKLSQARRLIFFLLRFIRVGCRVKEQLVPLKRAHNFTEKVKNGHRNGVISSS